MKFVFFVIVLLQSVISSGQDVQIKKVINKDKAHLAIGIKEGDRTNWYFAGCSFKKVTLLPDTIKLRLIAELLNYTSDTTVCDNPVFHLCGKYNTTRLQPASKQYSLPIDALLLINYIAFSSNACFFSPYPLLYNKENKTEVFYPGKELDHVIALYKSWFDDLKKKGFRDYCYPLYGKRYEWFAGRVKQQKFNRAPLWNSLYDCKAL